MAYFTQTTDLLINGRSHYQGDAPIYLTWTPPLIVGTYSQAWTSITINNNQSWMDFPEVVPHNASSYTFPPDSYFLTKLLTGDFPAQINIAFMGVDNAGSFFFGNSNVALFTRVPSAYSNVGAPTNLSFDSDNVLLGETTNLSWTAGSAGTNNPVTGYRIEYTEDGTTKSVYQALVTDTFCPVPPSPIIGTPRVYYVTTIGTQTGYDSSSYPTGVLSNYNNPALTDFEILPAPPVIAGSQISVSFEFDDGVNNPLQSVEIHYAGEVIPHDTTSPISITVADEELPLSLYFNSLRSGVVLADTVSIPVIILTYTQCLPPTNLLVTPSSISPSQTAELSWGAGVAGDNLSIVGYSVYSSIDSGVSWQHLTDVNYDVLTLNVSPNPNVGDSIIFSVVTRANVPAYNSDKSSPTTPLVTIGEPPKLNPPLNFQFQYSTLSIYEGTLTWALPQEVQDYIPTGFAIQYQDTGSNEWINFSTVGMVVELPVVLNMQQGDSRNFRIQTVGLDNTYSAFMYTGEIRTPFSPLQPIFQFPAFGAITYSEEVWVGIGVNPNNENVRCEISIDGDTYFTLRNNISEETVVIESVGSLDTGLHEIATRIVVNNIFYSNISTTQIEVRKSTYSREILSGSYIEPLTEGGHVLEIQELFDRINMTREAVGLTSVLPLGELNAYKNWLPHMLQLRGLIEDIREKLNISNIQWTEVEDEFPTAIVITEIRQYLSFATFYSI